MSETMPCEMCERIAARRLLFLMARMLRHDAGRVYKKAAIRAPAPTRLPAIAFMVAAAPVEDVEEAPLAPPDPERVPVVAAELLPPVTLPPLLFVGVALGNEVMVELPLVPTLRTTVLVELVPGIPWR